MAYLEFTNEKGPRRVELRDKPVTIGRQIGNVLSLNDEKLSRHHLVVERRRDGCYVRDLGSRNGTLVNGRLLAGEVKMDHGDVVKAGSHEFKYFSSSGAAAATPTAKRMIGNAPVSPDLQATRETAAPVAVAAAPQRQAPPPKWEMPVFDASDGAGPARQLATLADAMPVKPFGAQIIELFGARGDLVHAAYTDKDETPAETVTILRLLLLCCFRTRASDIHVEPKNDQWTCRIRTDGNMVTVAIMKKELGVRFMSLVKILCDIDIAARNIVQEGSFTSRVPGRRVDYRVSMTPSIFGQKLVIRVLDEANSPKFLWDLQLPEYMFRQIEKAMNRDSGTMLVCGPTGSGKTSTLYSIMRSIDANDRNIVTIEDPVEIQIPGLTQMPVNEEIGNSFAALLRSTLRQDPDVILVGEIRDAETAKTAMQAAMTGHSVYSTVHSRDTTGSIFRMLDLGVEPFLVASGLNLVLAQRLVRQLCPYCKQAALPSEDELREMGPKYETLTKVYRAGGCIRCLGTGFAGRRGVFELLVVDEAVRAAIAKNNQGEVLAALTGGRFTSLKTHGHSLVADGLTTFEEVDRVVGD